MGTLNPDEPHFQFTSHPPERGRPEINDPACSGACCCCCCCCLHTMGGLLGALAFSLNDTTQQRRLNPEELDYDDTIAERELASRSGMSVNTIYWLSMLMLTISAVVLGLLLGMQNNNGRPLEVSLIGTACVIVMVLPGVQLLALGLSLLIVAFGVGRGKLNEKARQLGRITLGTIIGTVIGIAIMAVPTLIMMYAK